MNTFASAIDNQLTTTENGMKARKSSASACVDLFYKIGASRGKNIVPSFIAAQAENQELALRIALWARDVRGGAGERQIFRDILQHLEYTEHPELCRVIPKVPELGRWDDLLVFTGKAQELADSYILAALAKNNQLCAKWMPRQGPHAERLRKRIGVSPKQWRKWLVSLTNVVEQKMCAKQWSQINFSQVPSLAHARYKQAFNRNAPQEYQAYANKLKTGETKINAAAVYPYDVIKGVQMQPRYSAAEVSVLEAQWNALPNYIGNADVLPLVDVSGSMCTPVSGLTVTALVVAVSLGLYCADKNSGAFNGCFLTFSESPELLNLRGSIVQKVQQMVRSNWAMNTNIAKAFRSILKTAVEGKVAQDQMPKILLILSDMQFDQCIQGYSAFELLEKEYETHGYEMPKVVFWNLAARDNAPVRFDQQGTALVSGFSPSVLKAILGGENFTPEGIMLKAVMQERYSY